MKLNSLTTSHLYIHVVPLQCMPSGFRPEYLVKIRYAGEQTGEAPGWNQSDSVSFYLLRKHLHFTPPTLLALLSQCFRFTQANIIEIII